VTESSSPVSPPTTAPVTGKKKRGRETAGDMLRSLAVVLALCVGMWFLAQPPDSDEQRIRVVDPTGDVAAMQADVPGLPAPQGLPDGWRPTSSTLTGSPQALRVGYVTPAGEYAEYAVSTAPREEYLPTIVGPRATDLAPVEVDGTTWEQQRSGDAVSLVRTAGRATVVVGSVRATAGDAELRELAASLEAAPPA